MNLIEQIKVNDVSIDGYQGTYYSESPEWVRVMTDADGNVLCGIRSDGTVYIPILDNPSIDSKLNDAIEEFNEKALQIEDDIDAKMALYDEILGCFSVIEDPEGRSEITTDSEGKIISYRGADGVKKEHVGFETPKVLISGNTIENIEDLEGRKEITTDSEDKVISYRDSKGAMHELAGIDTPTINGVPFEELLEKGDTTTINSCISVRDYNLPKYGKVEMLKELVYTDGANNYKPSKISKVGDKYYVTATLVDGQVVESSVEITIQEIDIDLTQWPVNTDTKHYVIAEIDFGSYLKGTFYVETKYQGNSSLFSPKKNFRFTFYKDILFSKKQNHKIGELISAKKYNLKAYYADSSLLKEQFGYRLIQAIRETRPYNKQYPWNGNYPLFTGATGLTNGFPFRLDISGNFQGVYWFNLAKDVNNFMLDEELMNGVLIQAETQDADFWQVLNKNHWSDILADIDDDISEDSLPHVQAFYDFINSGYSKSQAPSHMNINNWIDCIIILQVLHCADSLAKNMMLYAGDDKTIFSPMYYDLDLTLGAYSSNPRADVFTDSGTQAQDVSVWTNFMAHYWEDICDRYKELRQSVLTIEYMTALFESLCRSIEYSDYQSDIDKWHEGHGNSISSLVSYLNTRLQWIDENYFIK